MRQRTYLALVLLCLCGRASLAQENRIWLEGKINGKAVRLILDTGAFDSILLPDAARNFGLKIFQPVFDVPAKGFDVRLGRTEPFELAILNFSGRTTFGTYDFEQAGVKTRGDGIYGWKHMKTNLFMIDAAELTVKVLDRLPDQTTEWMKLAITTGDTLSLEVPGEFWTIAVDTGSYSGCFTETATVEGLESGAYKRAVNPGLESHAERWLHGHRRGIRP